MGIDERARHGLYLRAEEVLGHEEADALMALLPPVGWADVATKRDLDHLGERMEAGLRELRLEIGAAESRMEAFVHRELSRQLRVMVVVMLTLTSVLVAAVKL